MQKKQEYSAHTDPYREFRTSYELTQLTRHGVANPQLLSQKEAPVEYITGVLESNGMLFTVSPDVLIPRIETEELVEKVVHEYIDEFKTRQGNDQKISIIDIGTGSGYVGICVSSLLSLKFPQAQIKLALCDISPAALAVARENAQRNLTKSVQVEFILSDLLDAVQNNSLDSSQTEEAKKFDIILANLPYIPSLEVETLCESVKHFEPALALDGGADGFRIVARLLLQIPPHMHPQTHAWLEVDPTHTVEVCKANQPALKYKPHQDSFERHRFIEATLL